MDLVDVNVFDSNDDMEVSLLRRQLKNSYYLKIDIFIPNYFEEFNDLAFFKRFRLPKTTVHLLISQIEYKIKAPTLRNEAISPATKVCLAVLFYATSSMLIAAGDFTGVSQTSACNIVTQVTDAMATLRPVHVRFLETQAELLSTKELFYEIARFSYVVGALVVPIFASNHLAEMKQKDIGIERAIFRGMLKQFAMRVFTSRTSSKMAWIVTRSEYF
ncbi:hypothetical protein HUJ04_011220 [Dendroctonus ponderosae]|nr:hypothetical protein HUJ04_011220 [Dendroctonus ponderosae]KAH1028443.1 hypothetical protein HUJ05_001796 [Dendroctonus ponderosae]